MCRGCREWSVAALVFRTVRGLFQYFPMKPAEAKRQDPFSQPSSRMPAGILWKQCLCGRGEGGGGHSKKEKCLKLRLIGQSRMRACSSQLHAHTAWSLIRWGVRWALRRPAVWTPLFTLAGLVRLTVSTVQLGGISSRLKSSILNNANSTTGGGEAAAGCAGGTGLSVWWVLCAARCNLVIYCSTATL